MAHRQNFSFLVWTALIYYNIMYNYKKMKFVKYSLLWYYNH